MTLPAELPRRVEPVTPFLGQSPMPLRSGGTQDGWLSSTLGSSAEAASEEQLPVGDDDDCGHDQQESRLDDLGVGVRHEDFVRQVCRDVEDDWDEDAASRDEVEPVHQDHESDHRQREVEGVDPPGLDDLVVVVALDERQRKMPEGPVDREDHGGGEDRHSSDQCVRAIGVPRKFLEDGSTDECEPHWQQPGREREAAPELKLLGTVAESQRDGLSGQMLPSNNKSVTAR